MKRLIIVLFALVALTLPAFSQAIEDINGHDWRLWSTEQRAGYVQGFYSAYSSVWERMYLTMGESATEEDIERMEEWFYIPLNVGKMVERINTFYSDYDNRSEVLYMVLMYAAGKDYWNSSRFDAETNIEPSESPST